MHPAFRSAIAVTMLAGALCLSPAAQADDHLPGGPVFLTVTGSIANANRGAYDPEVDKFFGFNSVEFEEAREFDFDALASLPQVTVRADFPHGRQIHEYSGPLLADVLAAAGAEGDTVMVQALDGYTIFAPLDELVELGAVVALRRDGRVFGIGDFGPTQIVFPRADRPELQDMPDDLWVWSIFHINVE